MVMTPIPLRMNVGMTKENPKKIRRRAMLPRGSGPPDDDGDDDPQSDDSDEKFRRRMIKFLGGSIEPKTDDKPKVKEADTTKIPAFPLAETYRNWRIKTREAVVAASTDSDSAFKWVSESWKETQTLEALRRLRRLPLWIAEPLVGLKRLASFGAWGGGGGARFFPTGANLVQRWVRAIFVHWLVGAWKQENGVGNPFFGAGNPFFGAGNQFFW